jgi:hypothetical protein
VAWDLGVKRNGKCWEKEDLGHWYRSRICVSSRGKDMMYIMYDMELREGLMDSGRRDIYPFSAAIHTWQGLTFVRVFSDMHYTIHPINAYVSTFVVLLNSECAEQIVCSLEIVTDY